ncbi:non-hydrolyzing UDP-N-acetylglucosamine 2-epimerase [Saccharomonospora xinjiangensis]|uniref:UDP-N-acetylglucosamine 2-epimerase n=2 Tax=Saccharomonospora TaxID=1851 RepID=I0UXD9_9PSEU|nr:UDP-N-acetylglucosamine 2-epimerase (non-hydrolyzing) [Saccharomonospora xinjiangensis]EID52542.1 UDP-N-acetylglucosamine 2-epimerase [Saccharomonospora xinjiangensis XJ-54]
MTVALIVGTRPEAIKLAPLASLLGPEALVVHTGQHHTAGMTGHLTPDIELHTAHDTTRGAQLGAMTSALDQLFRKNRPDVVVVQGDTTSALAGALAANATDMPLVHVEAGLRSFDRAMPEEHHRVLIDHLADLCCAPTPVARDNLLAERIPPSRIAVTGNPIVEAVGHNLPQPEHQLQLLNQLGLTTSAFILATLHRPENTDNPDALETILRELTALREPVVLALHPRTQRQITKFSLTTLTREIRCSGPLDYPMLLTLIRHAAVVISDSGGVQEETTVLKRPILVIRRSNERPEVEATFGARLRPGQDIAGTVNQWLSDIAATHTRLADQRCPYGDGTATRRIADAMQTVRRSARTLCPVPKTSHHRPMSLRALSVQPSSSRM